VKPIILSGLWLFLNLSLFAQNKIIHGYVIDAATKERLPLANIQIEGTYKGTVSNREGRYEIKIESLPSILIVRYIGYNTARFTVTGETASEMNLLLEPSPVQMAEIIITGEDPGMRLMRGVIEKKKRWRKALQTFEADAYARVTLSNDTMIAMMMESVSSVFWDKKKGLKEIVRSKRQTANIDTGSLFSVTSGEDGMVNFYDDDISIQGSKFIGPTHPDALDYYRFVIIRKRAMDGKTVYDVSVKPKSMYQPSFTGTLSVLDEDSAMIDVNLKPHERVLFPPPIQEWAVTYKQQFSSFGQSFWLPVDNRQEGKIKIGIIGLEFPYFHYQMITGMNDYKVNATLPDSLYQSKNKRFVDSTHLFNDSMFARSAALIPLTLKEIEAYQTIDSDLTMDKVFEPKGFLAKMAKVSSRNQRERNKPDSSGLFSKIMRPVSPDLWYNRVEGGHLGMGYEINLTKYFELTPRIGYTTALNRWSFGGEMKWSFGKKPRHGAKPGTLKAGYASVADLRYPSDIHSKFSAGLSSFFGDQDYFDYFWNRKMYLSAAYEFRKIETRLQLQLNNEQHRSLLKTTDYALLGTDRHQRPNPAVQAGMLRSAVLKIEYGDAYIPLAVVGLRRAAVTVEHSSRALFRSGFDFTAYRFDGDWFVPTFFRRRFLSNALYLRATAGTYSGKLPVQRFGIVESSQSWYMPFGTLRTNQDYPYEGERYASFFWEHNFRTVPFEILGLNPLVKKNISFIVFGGAGRTWISGKRFAELDYTPKYTHHIHHEIGASISGIFDLLRLDIARRLDRRGTYYGISMARLF